VGAEGVVDVLPFAQGGVHFGERGGELDDLVKLFPVGAVGTFDVPVQFGGARGQHEELDAAVLASLLELGHEFGAAVYLDGPDREGHALKDRIQEAGRCVSSGTVVRLQYLPAAVDVAGGEVLEAEAGEELNVYSVDLDDVPGRRGQVLFGLADAVGAFELGGSMPGIVQGSGGQLARVAKLA